METRSEGDLGSHETAASGDSHERRAPSSELPPGAVVGGRYRVLRRVGRGGMGAVYEAFEEVIERRVALKLLHPMAAEEPQLAGRFLEEARLANRVRHPAIVEVTDYGVHEGRPFLVMELLDGESLAARIEREGDFQPAAALALLAPVFAALAHLHERGVVHRDLKPDNLFLARVGGDVAPRILDLGIAKAHAEGQSVTATDAMLGTPAYMAPEQVRSSRSVTALADQYAMGCVLYEMLTGRLPIEADNLHGILVAKVTEAPTPLRAHRPELPAAFADAVMRAVARDPAERFPDVPAFVAALEGALATSAFSTTARAVAVDLPAPLDAASPAPPALAPRPRAPARALVAAAVACAAVALAAWATQRPAPPPAITRATPRAAPPPAAALAPPPAALAPPAAPDAAPLARAEDAAVALEAPSPPRRHHAAHRRAPSPPPSAPTPTTGPAFSRQMD